MNEMTIVLGVLLILVAFIGWRATDYYRSKAEEFESLFELSKGYGVSIVSIDPTDIKPAIPESYKLNKDGSIAKKRGRKPRNAKTT